MGAGSKSQQLYRIRAATGFEPGSNRVRTGFEEAGGVQPLTTMKDRTGFEQAGGVQPLTAIKDQLGFAPGPKRLGVYSHLRQLQMEPISNQVRTAFEQAGSAQPITAMRERTRFEQFQK